jgi:hypothetical protein
MVKRVFALGSKYGAQAPLDLGFEDKTLIGGPCFTKWHLEPLIG